jgi:hypothetical protein
MFHKCPLMMPFKNLVARLGVVNRGLRMSGGGFLAFRCDRWFTQFGLLKSFEIKQPSFFERGQK